MRKRIFVLEDDRDLVDLLQYNLERDGFQVAFATEGTLALPSLRRFAPDLLILDLMLPGMDGMEVCRQIRQNPSYASLPILMLTARTEETDRVVGLEMGADDYVTKPFSMRELIARVRALLRRQESADMDRSVIQLGSIHIDKSAHKVRLGSRSVELSALEFRLLHLLASNPGIVFSRNQLLDRVWGTDRNVSPRSVDVYIRRLREKIEAKADHPAFIQTVHGVGYRFAEAS